MVYKGFGRKLTAAKVLSTVVPLCPLFSMAPGGLFSLVRSDDSPRDKSVV
jgi:hypothetical protein